jgi:CRP-like cAMP-binding protein
MDAVALPASVRLAKALLHLADLHSQRVNGHVQIGFRLSQRELGAMTGLIRESINKHLKAWRAAGWVSLSGGTVTLRDEHALRNFVRDNEAR